MSDLKKAAEMALGVLLDPKTTANEVADAIKTIRQALAQPEQEPVAWVYNGILHEFDPSEFATSEVTPLYIAPPKRKWVGLTEWMPIETAPKNGTEVLVMYVHIDTQVVHNGFWLGANDTDDESDIGWWSYEHSEVSRIKLDDWMTPTHWLPLPKLKEKNT